MSARDMLVVAEIQQGELHEVTLELLAAARGVTAASGGQVLVLVLSPDGRRYVPSLGGADRCLLVDSPDFANYCPDSYLATALDVIAACRPRAVLIGSTSAGWDVAPLLAARLNAPLVVGCRAVQSDGDQLQVTASFCGGKMNAEVEVSDCPAILMVLPGSLRSTAEPGLAQVEIRTPPAPPAPPAIQFQQLIVPEAGDVDITQQDCLVAVGRGIQQQDNVELAEELARSLGGAVCASRPVVDQGWLPATRQVGKSGMTVKPKLYLALGVSGAPEHLEGMKDSELVIAVNTDPHAPIFDAAHYGAEVDLLDLLPALVEEINARKSVSS